MTNVSSFVATSLHLKDTEASNVVVNPEAKIRVSQNEEYTPYQLLFEQTRYYVMPYVGITSQADLTIRPGLYIVQKYRYRSKQEMLDDGWYILPSVVQFPEPNFDCRRYTTAWTERLVQMYIESFAPRVEVQWDHVEPAAAFGENRNNLADNGMNVMYMCFKLISL